MPPNFTREEYRNLVEQEIKERHERLEDLREEWRRERHNAMWMGTFQEYLVMKLMVEERLASDYEYKEEAEARGYDSY